MLCAVRMKLRASNEHERRAGTRPVSFLLLVLLVACGTNDRAVASQPTTGSARDADTNEPIEGAWIFEVERAKASGADVLRVKSARMTRSAADGSFRFDAPSGLRLFGPDYPAQYLFYHPSYGLLRARAEKNPHEVRLRPSLRDAHLRQADAIAFCTNPARDDMARKMIELACPPDLPGRFTNGQPRAQGAVDDRDRRTGLWTFFRADGSVVARGEYRMGAAVGDWRFEAPN